MATPLNSPAHQLSISNHVGKWIFIAAAAIVLVGALTWVNYHYCVQNPGGNDFLVHWSGTRTFLTDRISPYSDTAALRIQTIAYGRPALPGEHELRVAYPFYSAILFAPFALISDFTLARAAWMTLLEVALILLAIFSLRLAKWQPPLALLAAILIFILIWYFGLR